MSQHTAEPWHYEHPMTRDLFADDEEWAEYLAEDPPIVRIAGPNDETVATAHDLFKFKKEDARLIVAAPRLLAALRRIANHEARTSRKARHLIDVADFDSLQTIALTALEGLDDLQ